MAYKYFETAGHAAIYSKFRPCTPETLIQRIVTYISEKIPGPLKVAVDVGCGSGQSTQVLAPYFSEVYGFDPNETAIAEAIRKGKIPNVSYGTSTAEKLNFQENSVTLVTAGQACHWFDLPAFYEEVKRILVPGGTLALYGYQLPRPRFHGSSPTDLSSIVDKFYGDTLGNYVLQQSRECYLEKYSNERYQIPFSTRPLTRDESVYLEQKGTLADLVGYVSSWSAFQNYQKQNGPEKASSILMDFEKELLDATGSKMKPEETDITVRFNYFLLLGRKAL
ncbi:putative methyltransferase DDB_G0268948 isoform X1 [Ischnura elegans]|uniref:putative methyltransferase DDB_G0268948 isoform X1 n=1 Tax=Ischnura elegans TaxID=197161 RepID=UPI001ED88EFD|nr:putative methyltransferase DDB_G0268948 isoform X1 [Ischnura elegans]